MRALLPLVVLLSLSACANGDTILVVESSGPWEGTVTSGAQVTHASGDASGWEFPLLGEAACWEFHNDGGPDGLRAYVRRSALAGVDRVGYDETTDAHGVVRGCS